MEKLDLSKKYKTYFTAQKSPQIVEIEPAQFLSLTGKGDPSGQAFLEKIQALYATAYTLKFMYKSANKDFVVSKLEALWWFDESKFAGITMDNAPQKIDRSEWEYRLLIRMPEYVNGQEVAKAKDAAFDKKKWPLIKELELFQMAEGKSVQLLHLGPFDKEPETLAIMAKFMTEKEFSKNGHHHEIYLSDFNKTAPDKLKTILREPVR